MKQLVMYMSKCSAEIQEYCPDCLLTVYYYTLKRLENTVVSIFMAAFVIFPLPEKKMRAEKHSKN